MNLKENIDAEKTGKFIASLRKSQGMTQDALGEKLFITRKAVSKWETGRATPSIDMLKRLSEVLDVSLDDLIAGEFSVEPNEKKNLIFDIIKTKTFRNMFRAIMALLFVIIIGFFIYNIFATKIYSINYEDSNFSLVNGILTITKNTSHINFGTIVNRVGDTCDETKFDYTLYYYDRDVEVEIISFSKLDSTYYLDNSIGYLKSFSPFGIKPLYLRIVYTNDYHEEKVYDLRLKLQRTFEKPPIVEKEDAIIPLEADEVENYNTEFLFRMSEEEIRKNFDGKSITVDKKKYSISYNEDENNLEIKYKDETITVYFEMDRILIEDSKITHIFIKDDFYFNWDGTTGEERELIINIMEQLELLVVSKK